MQKNKTKDIIKKIIVYIVLMIFGGACGFTLSMVAGKSGFISKQQGTKLPLFIVLELLILVVAFMIELIIHEAGHLVFGLISGYEFVSFRIGSLTFVKDPHGNIRLKKYNIAGTAGQCLMMPPEKEHYDIPFVLYNLGGVIMNLITGILCFILSYSLNLPAFIKLFLFSMSLSALYILITNGIPMKIGGISNDGLNALTIGKNINALKGFYISLRSNGLLNEGVRLKDMPKEWFDIEDTLDFNDSTTASLKLIEASYHCEYFDFDSAKNCLELLLNNAPKLVELYKNEARCELLFIKIIQGCSNEEIDNLYTKSLIRYINASKYHLSKKRLMYAYTLLVKKDVVKAQKIKDEFYNLREKFPSIGEAKMETELLEYVDTVAHENENT